MAKLYEITGALMRVIDAYNEVTEDEQLEAIATILTDLEMKFEEKSVAVAHHIRNMEGDIAALDMEIERLTKMKKQRKNAIEWFTKYIKNSMEATGISKVESPTMTLRLQKNPPSVEVLDEEAIPKEYKREKIEILIDKKAILDDFKKSGVGVTGTQVVQKQRLVIK